MEKGFCCAPQFLLKIMCRDIKVEDLNIRPSKQQFKNQAEKLHFRGSSFF